MKKLVKVISVQHSGDMLTHFCQEDKIDKFVENLINNGHIMIGKPQIASTSEIKIRQNFIKKNFIKLERLPSYNWAGFFNG